MGGLEALASGREGRGERREERPAGREALGQLAARRVHELPEYFKSGAPYGPTNEGMMRWISERAAAAERLAVVTSPPMQASHRDRTSVAAGERTRSFAED